MQEQKVSIVHIFNHLTNTHSIVDFIQKNSFFLEQHGVEYIILDNLQNQQKNHILENISKMESYQNGKIEYIKEKDVLNLKNIFLTGIELASSENIFFIFNEVELNINNIFDIEKSAPFLQKQDLNFFQQNVPDNFHPKNFKLHMKKNKNILDKLKLMFV